MKKISLLIFSIVVVSILSYGFFSVWQFKSDKLKYIHIVNSTLTMNIAEKVESFFESTASDVNNLVSVIRFSKIEKDKTPILRAMFQANPDFVGLAVYKKKGSGEVTAPESGDAAPAPSPSENTGFEISYAIYNKDFLELHQLSEESVKSLELTNINEFLSKAPGKSNELFIATSLENRLFSYVVPLGDAMTHFAVLSVSQESLYEAISEAEVQESFLIDEGGRIVAHPEKEMVGTSANSHPLVKFARENPFKDGGREYLWEARATEYVGNYSKLGRGLTLISQTNKDRAFQGMKIIVINTMLFAVNIVGIAILIGVLFSRTITAPLQKLMAITEDIAAGNYNVQPDIRTNDEVAQLADYFKTLGQKLTEREEQLEKVTELAIKDGMTGAYNHRHFRNRIVEYFSLAKRHEKDLCLCIVDIDFFKKFNDDFGHQQGDQVIKDIAKILNATARTTDFVARYGGEEFVIVLPETDLQGAVIVAERVRQNYKSHRIVNLAGGDPLSSTCSVGVASIKEADFKTPEEFIEKADQNLYAAKKGGRDRVVSSLGTSNIALMAEGAGPQAGPAPVSSPETIPAGLPESLSTATPGELPIPPKE